MIYQKLGSKYVHVEDIRFSMTLTDLWYVQPHVSKECSEKSGVLGLCYKADFQNFAFQHVFISNNLFIPVTHVFIA